MPPEALISSKARSKDFFSISPNLAWDPVSGKTIPTFTVSAADTLLTNMPSIQNILIKQTINLFIKSPHEKKLRVMNILKKIFWEIID